MALDFPSSPTVGQKYPASPIAGIPTYTWDGEKWTTTGPTGAGSSVIRSYLAGLTLSVAGSSATFGIAPGVATDSTNAAMMTLASAYTKTASAWAVGNGNGALDTGAINAAAWYHVFLIRRPDTGVVDVVISATATPANGPTVMPANYTQFRRIGSMKTLASQWIAFTQYGDEFMWNSPNGGGTADVTNAETGTATNTGTLALVPSGIVVKALLSVYAYSNAGAGLSVYIRSLTAVDAVPSGNITGMTIRDSSSGGGNSAQVGIWTNTSQQFAYRTTASASFFANTIGWIDRRGRDA